jgi:hypothetical protein
MQQLMLSSSDAEKDEASISCVEYLLGPRIFAAAIEDGQHLAGC